MRTTNPRLPTQREMVVVLQMLGFRVDRAKGSHLIMVGPTRRPIPVPYGHGGQVVTHTVYNNAATTLRSAGIDLRAFLDDYWGRSR